MTFKPKYNFAALQVGWAFEFDTGTEKTPKGEFREVVKVRQAASQWKRRHQGWNYEIRQLGNGKAQLERTA